MSFYNTIELKEPELKKARVKARRQEDQIYSFMVTMGFEYTAWELKEIFSNWEITSIRRALWNLENKDKKIEQTGFVENGGKGKPVGKYRAVKQTKLF